MPASNRRHFGSVRKLPSKRWQASYWHIGSRHPAPHVRRTFARIGKRAGIADARYPYLLRHSAVSLLLDNGASIEEVADLLGDDPRTLYRHYRQKVRPVAEAATRMEAVLSATAANTTRT